MVVSKLFITLPTDLRNKEFNNLIFTIMKKMNFADVANVVSNYAANGSRTRFGHNFVCVVSLKKDRVYAGGQHLIGHVAKLTMVNNATFPKYDSKIASVTGMPISPKPLNGMTWLMYPYIKQANKSGYRYLNIYYAMSDERIETTTKWLVDGRLATPTEVAEIEMWLKPSNSNREVTAAMYQIDEIYKWDGFYYFGEDKAKAKKIFEKLQ